jgi:hypothetical protein
MIFQLIWEADGTAAKWLADGKSFANSHDILVVLPPNYVYDSNEGSTTESSFCLKFKPANTKVFANNFSKPKKMGSTVLTPRPGAVAYATVYTKPAESGPAVQHPPPEPTQDLNHGTEKGGEGVEGSWNSESRVNEDN